METEKTTREKILTNRFFPLILMGLNLYFFFYLIPLDIAESYSTILAILGGIITMILCFWIVFSWVKSDKLLDQIGIPLYIVSIASIFVFGYFFIVKTSDFASNELAKNAVYTEALVADKTKIYGKRGRSIQSINVIFTTENNKQVSAKISVTENYYEYLSKGMRIPIVYSSKHPNIAEIDFKKLRQQ